jgi:trimeric autotransporter adhesin
MKTSKFSIVVKLAPAMFGVFLSTFPLALAAASGDEHWDAQFGAPGLTNVFVYAVAVNNGVVYAAGITTSGGRTNTPLNAWDGKQWSVPAVFSGPAINGPSQMQVNDLAFMGNTLYAAGSFTNVNGVTANGLAKWDGTSWSSIGFSGIAYALAVDGNNLYVGGIFTNVDSGGITMTNIGYWDGSAWHALGNGLGVPGVAFAVRALAIKSGVVYAGGIFFNSGSQSITNLAVWNGSTWSDVGGNVNGTVFSLAFNGSDLYAGGAFTQAGTTPANSIARWDGANWSALGSGLTGASGVAESIAVFNGAVCVAGSFTNAGGLSATCFATWNGLSWSAAAGNLNAVGYRAVASGPNLYVGGSFTVAGGVWVNEIALWDGNQWSAFGTPGWLNGVQSSVTALASDGTNLYAGGFFTYAGQTNASYIARFDGRNWQPLGAGLNNQVVALAVANNLVYAGGYFTGTTDGQPLQYIGCWDGTNWNSLGNAGGLVYALAVGSNGVYAAGTYYTGNAYGSPFFNRWDGTSWQGVLQFTNNTLFAVPLSDPIGYDAIAIQGTNVYLGGNITGFSQFDPNLGIGFSPITNCLNILRFDGTYGWIMGTGLNKTNVALAVLGTNVFAAGTFTTAGGVAANQIAKWDGNSWSSVGGSVVGSGTVLALTTMGNNLYAGGTFTNIGSVTASRIAKWDGTNWSALGSGVSGTVQSLVTIGPDVYAGGGIRFAGGKPSYNMAHWNAQLNFNTPQLVNPAWLTNQQFQVRLMGIGGLTNIIQASTNLSSWTPILTNSTGVYDFTDTSASNYPSRFYRALPGP